MKKSVISELMPSRKRKNRSKPKGFGNSKESQKHREDVDVQKYIFEHFDDIQDSLPPKKVDFIWAIIPTLEEPGENLGRPIPENNCFIFWSEDYNEAINYEKTHKNCFMLPMVRAEENPELWRAATKEDFSRT